MKNLGRTILLSILLFGPVRGKTFATGDLNSVPILNLNPIDAVNSAEIAGFDVGDLSNVVQIKSLWDFRGLNIDTNIPISPKFNESQGFPGINLKQFLTPKDVSSDDLAGAVRAILTLVIEIFLVVISITSQILKLILEFLR